MQTRALLPSTFGKKVIKPEEWYASNVFHDLVTGKYDASLPQQPNQSVFATPSVKELLIAFTEIPFGEWKIGLIELPCEVFLSVVCNIIFVTFCF